MSHKAIILVTGGAGYIGSHMVWLLQQEGYFPIILDNLSTSSLPTFSSIPFFHGNINDSLLIEQIHGQFPFQAVIHFASFTRVGESVIDPLKYYQNNLASSIEFCASLKKLSISKLIFSSSAAVYGESKNNRLLTEECAKQPLNAYGKSKWMLEQIFEDLASAYDFQTICLRYFNVAGGDKQIKRTKRLTPSANLIPIALSAAINATPLLVYGDQYPTKDGTCIRDYIHVNDVCKAHLRALELLLSQVRKNYLSINLGTNIGHSVLDVIKTIETVTKLKINWQITQPRLGDPAVLVADNQRAIEYLNWLPKHSQLSQIIYDAWQYEAAALNEINAATFN